MIASALVFLAACTLVYSKDGYATGPAGVGDGGSDDGGGGDAGADATARSTYREAVLADGPIAYWRFGESSGEVARDETGRHDGTFHAVVLGAPGAIAGDPSSGIELDTTSSGVVVDSALDIVGGAAFTLEIWAKPALVDTVNRRLFTKFETVSGKVEGWSLVHDAVKHLELETYVGGAWAGGLTDASLPVDVYSHVVVTYDAQLLRMWVDGALASEWSTRIAMNGNAATLVIGALSTVDGNNWRGALDEAAIYDHALSAARVAEHYRIGTAR